MTIAIAIAHTLHARTNRPAATEPWKTTAIFMIEPYFHAKHTIEHAVKQYPSARFQAEGGKEPYPLMATEQNSLFEENLPIKEETGVNSQADAEDEELQDFDPAQHPLEAYTTSQEVFDSGKPKAPILTPEKILSAKRIYISGHGLRETARRLGVPEQSIASTKYFNRWNFTLEDAQEREKNLAKLNKKPKTVYEPVTPSIIAHAKELLSANIPMEQVAQKLNVAKTTLIRHLDHDDFVNHDLLEEKNSEEPQERKLTIGFSPNQASMREQITTKVVELTTKQLVAKAEEQGVLQAMTNDVAQELRDHALVGRALMIAVKKTIAEFIAGEISPARNQSRCDVLLSLVNASRAAVSMTREIHGRTAGQTSIPANTTNDRKRFVVATPEELPNNDLQLSA